MRFELLHPADQLVLMMDRIYRGGLTTTSGGNLSILDGNGDIWITPSGVDKGTLTRADMCCVKPDGTIIGAHKPSMELPFHASVYRRRPDIHAVLHAHPPALVAFSLARTLPDVNLVVGARRICGALTLAKYALPGSTALGDIIAAEFAKGFNIVVLENHGVAVGADNMHEAFMKFETLESAALTEISARKLGRLKSLQNSEYSLSASCDHLTMDEFHPAPPSPAECAARRDMAALVHRAHRQKLFGSAQGACSMRLTGDSFLITPHGVDRAYLEEADLVLVRGGMKERGKVPSCSIQLHRMIYEQNPDIHAILGAAPLHAMAFAVTGEPLDPRTIPESYIMLRNVQKADCSASYQMPEKVAGMFSRQTPVMICENDQILATGSSLINAFDRLEVTEATASSILSVRDIGKIVHISDAEVKDIDAAFHLND